MEDPRLQDFKDCEALNRSGVALLLILVLLANQAAFAGGKKGASAGITLSEDGEGGVVTEAQTYFPHNAAVTSGPASADGGAPVVLVGIQPHTCAPVLSEGGRGGSGLPLGLTFADATSNCLSFAPPPLTTAASEDPETLSPSELAAIAADRAMALAARPQLAVAPASVGLTGLPSYFWLAERLQPVAATAVVPGLRVTAEATPVSYLWNFGDGAELSTRRPGRAWRKDRRGNISHLYEKRGAYELRVRAIWRARWRIGTGPWRALGYFANEDSLRYPVRQVRARLTRSRR